MGTRISLKTNIPKKIFDTPKGRASKEKALDSIADEAVKAFEKTTATWKNKPEVRVQKTVNTRQVYVIGKIYSYVDKGTEPHPIFPRRARVLAWRGGFKAKTRPNVVSSSGGGASGKMVFRKYVLKHPGTKPRNFSIIIRDRMQKRLDAEAAKILKAYKVK